MKNPQPTIDAPRVVPVFPLENTVFFPKTSLPLHVFEPRYRAMVRDAVDADGLIVVALAEGDEFHSVGTLGRIRDLDSLDDGRFNLRLEGLKRVDTWEVPCRTAYRQVRAEPRAERAVVTDRSRNERAKLELLAAIGLLRSAAQPHDRTIVLHQNLPFEVVVNTACAGLPIEAHLRQALLEEDDLTRRQQALSEYLTIVVDAVSQLTTSTDEPDMLLN